MKRSRKPALTRQFSPPPSPVTDVRPAKLLAADLERDARNRPAASAGALQRALPIASRCRWLELLVVLLSALVIYQASGIISSADSHFVIPTALTILHHGSAVIDEYDQQFSEAPWAVRYEKGHFRNVYPIGVPLMTLPLVWLLDWIKFSEGTDFEKAAILQAPLSEEHLLASLITAAAVGLLYLVFRRRLPFSKSAALALLFALGTTAYSSASRGLWQHGPSLLLMSAALLVYDYLDSWKPAGFLLGLLAGYAYTVRPTNMLLVGGFLVLLALTARSRVPLYLCGCVLGVAPLFVYDQIAFGTWLNFYYRNEYTTLNPHFWVGLLGTLFSASRGLFVFSPFLLLVFLRLLPVNIRKHPFTALEGLLILLAIGYWAGSSIWVNWMGGGSYGPRILTELLPCLLVLLVPLVADLRIRPRPSFLAAAFLITGGLSIAIHFRGATNRAVHEWNATPVSIDAAPERVWSWRDPQFLRGL